MKIIRYLDSQEQIHYGAAQGDGSAIELTGELFSGLQSTDRRADVAKLLAPLAPSQILGIGLNYRRHAEETKARIPEFPVLFIKGLNSLQNRRSDFHSDPSHSEKWTTNAELAVVIGRPCKNVSRKRALDYVFGYTCANDVSARDWQKRKGGSQWCRGKSFDSFCPLGPCLVTAEEIPDPNALSIRTILNDTIVQDANTNDMIFDVPSIIEFLSGSTTLPAGTTILTGTPHGVGMAANPPRWLKVGDRVSIVVERIGKLTNPVESEPSPVAGSDPDRFA
jgi:2-keto-4-pentenoate hydratase/2-oxohepta-3-ene-1,7-dioic acid hydratase in catechol pathway